MIKSKFELLAPAGDFPSMIAAVEAGADAVYFGLKEFNMRDSAKNFNISDLDEIAIICGDNVKKYLTLNTIIYNDELDDLENIFKKIKGKVDAIICWDFSVIKLCNKYEIPFHVSTQASVSNSESAEFYKNLGAERIVLARELNLEQIKKISKIVEVECFIHGAMCVSVSGRCFTSQFLCGKSANKGKCLQFCRRAYIVKDEEGNELKLENNKVMSAKDLCTLPFIEDLKNAGIKNFKIEGRNRNPEYVKTVVSVYREALDNKLTQDEIKKGLEKLKLVYNRGFSSGFYLGLPTADDFSKSEDGEAGERKIVLGKVLHYWSKIGVAAIKLTAHELNVGNEIYIIGEKTGVARAKVECIEIEHKNISKADKGKIVGIKVPKCRKGDAVYLIEKNN
ncbi:MAG: peptidase U32 family protein [archaeon]|nr:peptidase U32 family protein [archaeon]